MLIKFCSDNKNIELNMDQKGMLKLTKNLTNCIGKIVWIAGVNLIVDIRTPY